jgi:DNA repair exonuclease SbcCD ATPase subunit
MIIFEKICWRNFLSTGNQFTEINLLENSTTLIVGSNGAGKSTILDALTFVLFGKSFRGINKPQLVNTVNEKDCLVEINFKIGSIKWKVQRGIKPNIFKIYKNNQLVDQSSSAVDQQKWFEQVVLKMNYKSFTQIVILGSSNFVPFMQLSSAHRREVIEDLLDIKIFSSMNNIIKDKVRVLREEIKTLELKKQSLKDKVQMQRDFIEEIENQGKQNIDKKKKTITQLLKECDSYILKNDEVEEQIFSLNKNLQEVSGASDKLKKLGNLKGKISQKVSAITAEHKFFTKNTVCPTCTQEIDEEFRLNRISESETKAKELQSGYEELQTAIHDEEIRESHFLRISKEITNLNHEISQNNTRVSGHQRQIRDLESEIQTITERLENRTSENKKLEDFMNDLQKTFSDLSSKKDLIQYHEFSFSLLKDSGVKSKIIKKYLPLINQQINRYLQMLDFYINFTLDEEFNETVQSPIHEDFSYSSFSEGEKQRIDLALLFTWREVAKFKNSTNTNLLIMDEIFDSSLDGYGTDEFLKIIRYVIKDANIFVISHKTGMEDKFQNVIKFEKVKGFSCKK